MSNHFPIPSPPPELVEEWFNNSPIDRGLTLATQAAQWGADQELDACCEWLAYEGHEHEHLALRAARRPKPPSRKEQALEAIGRLCASVIHDDLKNDAATIRRALEALDD